MEPKDLLKKLHPNQFSDSKNVEKVDCPRDLLDFIISTLSEKNMHFDFEDLVRKLMEREVCPNLIEETGPASGGDGKVDTENYPVSKELQKFWYYGLNENNEKWAVAVSLKKDWKSKCNDDIEKIIKTDRNYKKIFFVTSQAIPNKKREEYQDEKIKETGIDIVIFDKTWILDKLLKDSNLDLIKESNISTPLIEKEIGPNDLKKQRRRDEIEKELLKFAQNKKLNQKVIDLAIESAIISRDLEEDESIVVGKFERASRLAEEKGNINAQKDILYNIAWYYHWWLNNDVGFEKYYTLYEKEVLKNNNIDDIMNLSNLWILAYTRKKRNKEDVKSKTQNILELLNDQKKSKSRVVQLEAESRECLIRILLKENVDEQFKSLLNITEEASKFKEFNFIILAKMIENLLEVYGNNINYNQLYDLVTEKLSDRSSDIQKAEMYLKKAKLLSKNEERYNAIVLLGKCLTLLYKEESNGKLVEAYINIGANFESVGLLYAAKNYYIAAVALFMDLFLKDNDLDPFVLKILDRIIGMEIHIGNVEESIEWLNIKNLFLSILIDKNEPYSEELEQTILEADAFIASQILDTKVKNFKDLGRIIYLCNKSGLISSSIMANYVLGEYDEELLKECENDKKMVDKYILDFYKESKIHNISPPIYNDTEEKIIESKICGNKILIHYNGTKMYKRFAEFILGLLENTFATMTNNGIYMRGDIVINLLEKNTGKFNTKYTFNGIETYIIEIDTIDLYDISIENHTIITDMLFKLLANIFAINFIYKDENTLFKQLFDDDKTFERSLNHTSSLYNLNKIFGNDDYSDIPNIEINRNKEWYSDLRIDIPKKEGVKIYPFDEKRDIKYDSEPGDLFKNVSHDNIYSSDIIKCNHWDAAKWKGVMYLGDINNKEFIKIGFIFEGEEGAKKVFQDIINVTTKDDTKEKIILSFIKGVDKKAIYDYRVMITGKIEIPKNIKENAIINMATRFHQMNCGNDKNINILEKIISGKNPKISILPVTSRDGKMIPLYDYEIFIKKISIKKAYEIGKNDIESAAILPTDNPIIPDGVEGAPIQELLELKKKRSSPLKD